MMDPNSASQSSENHGRRAQIYPSIYGHSLAYEGSDHPTPIRAFDLPHDLQENLRVPQSIQIDVDPLPITPVQRIAHDVAHSLGEHLKLTSVDAYQVAREGDGSLSIAPGRKTKPDEIVDAYQLSKRFGDMLFIYPYKKTGPQEKLMPVLRDNGEPLEIPGNELPEHARQKAREQMVDEKFQLSPLIREEKGADHPDPVFDGIREYLHQHNPSLEQFHNAHGMPYDIPVEALPANVRQQAIEKIGEYDDLSPMIHRNRDGTTIDPVFDALKHRIHQDIPPAVGSYTITLKTRENGNAIGLQASPYDQANIPLHKTPIDAAALPDHAKESLEKLFTPQHWAKLPHDNHGRPYVNVEVSNGRISHARQSPAPNTPGR